MNLDSNVVIDIDDINVADKNSCLIIYVKHGNDLSPKLLSWINILIYGLEGCRFIMAMCTYVRRPSSSIIKFFRLFQDYCLFKSLFCYVRASDIV